VRRELQRLSLPAVDISCDHFALFDLAPGYAVDMPVLEQRFRDIQARVHPDKHAHLSEAERRISMQWASQANQAFQTLKSPLKRAQYLLALRGIDPQIERNTAMPMAFLMQQMECREGVADARSAGNVAALEALQHELNSEMKAEYAALAQQLDGSGDNEAAAQTVRRLLFKEKLFLEINDAIEAIETA
jgi:molecular chaperone HscB